LLPLLRLLRGARVLVRGLALGLPRSRGRRGSGLALLPLLEYDVAGGRREREEGLPGARGPENNPEGGAADAGGSDRRVDGEG